MLWTYNVCAQEIRKILARESTLHEMKQTSTGPNHILPIPCIGLPI